MKKFLNWAALIAIVGLIAACSLLKGKQMDQQKDIDSLLATVESECQKHPLFSIEIRAKEALENTIGEVNIIYLDENNKEIYEQQYDLSSNSWDDPVKFDGYHHFNEAKPSSFKELTKEFHKIVQFSQEAKTSVDSISKGELIEPTLYTVTAETMDEGIKTSLSLSARKKGEKPKRTGRMVEYTYYDLPFVIQNGKLVLVEP